MVARSPPTCYGPAVHTPSEPLVTATSGTSHTFLFFVLPGPLQICSASEMTFAGVRGHDSCRWSLDSCSSVLWEGIAFAMAAGPGEGDAGWTGWERLDTRKWRALGEFRTSSSPQEEQVEAPGVWVQLTVGEGKEGPRRCRIDSSWGLILPYLTSSLGHRRGLWPRWTSHNMAAL